MISKEDYEFYEKIKYDEGFQFLSEYIKERVRKLVLEYENYILTGEQNETAR